MNTALLIDAIVRQTVILIASLATAAGYRGQLAHVADEVFAELVRELRRQGLGNNVIADMFGLALRTYHSRVARLAHSHTAGGTSLWEAVLAFVQTRGDVMRGDVLARFARDDESAVRSVLRDLVDSGLVSRTGRGDATRFAPVAGDSPLRDDPRQADALVLVAVHRYGPIELAELSARVPFTDPKTLQAALDRLCAQGSIQPDGTLFRADRCVIDYADSAGWEAAVFDHYQAMVSAIVAKLDGGTRRAAPSDTIGGSTFAFDLTEDHPLKGEVLGFLERVREQGSDLRKRVLASQHETTSAAPLRVTAYVGQLVQYGEEPNETG